MNIINKENIWQQIETEVLGRNENEFTCGGSVATGLIELSSFIRVPVESSGEVNIDKLILIGTCNGIKCWVDPRIKWNDTNIICKGEVIPTGIESKNFL